MVIPMHGEHRHLREHAKIAENAGYASLICVNGMMLDLSGNRPTVTEYVETGRMYLDGSTQIGALDGVIRDRLRMALYGHVIVTVILDEEDEMIGEPWCEVRGFRRWDHLMPPCRCAGGGSKPIYRTCRS